MSAPEPTTGAVDTAPAVQTAEGHPLTATEVEKWHREGVITNPPTLEWGTWATTRRWQPRTVKATWLRERRRYGDEPFGEWSPWKLDGARYTGPRILNSGRDGAETQTGAAAEYTFRERIDRGGEWPADRLFLVAWIRAVAPPAWRYAEPAPGAES